LDCLKVVFAGLVAGWVSWALSAILIWPQDFLGLLIEVVISALSGLGVFVLISCSLGVAEVRELVLVLRYRISPR
jgi:putative peptidoglycan lipid II flippase